MPSQQLENLAKSGQLKKEPGARAELNGLLASGRAKLRDADVKGLSIESRFDLSYNAAHALALAALRWHGYRSENRFTVFQCLVHTTDLSAAQVRILSDAHSRRNRSEYEGVTDISPSMIDSVIKISKLIMAYLEKLKPPA